ncbi:MAG: ABC transporter ATP-binding protein [Bacteroidales bacterium]|nr:ABC transporter ATP-binding protein [Bacteroidales bacterium]
MMATAIEFNHVGKQYRLGLVSTRTLSHDFNRWWQTAILKKEDPYLKIGETNDRSVAGNSEYVWALRDIDFKVEQGDVVGIIGKNGAGKSTLLKLLSKVTGPTVGSIRARGRIGSLLEVGTGFHPEMTGRENIFMNGAIMGMSKSEVARKLDEIIDFSGCERYIDTPVKRYSSGMTVRLGFAVAAHLEPEILVVDEVLAVGDAEFQKKAIGKMQDVSRGEGRTVLFVSHNMASIRNLCHRGVVLENGSVFFDGDVNDAIDQYLNKFSPDEHRSVKDAIIMKSSFLEISSIRINGKEKPESTVVSNQEFLDIEIEGYTSEPFEYDVMLTFKNTSDVALASLAEGHYKGVISHISIGTFSIKKQVILPKYLGKGDVMVDLVMHHPNVMYLLQCPNCALLHLDGSFDGYGSPLSLPQRGICGLESK